MRTFLAVSSGRGFGLDSRRDQRRRALAAAAVRQVCETLEQRCLLSTINWTNRVAGDNFAIYGANTGAARSIVDRAISDWERVITNFNYTGGGNTYSVTITASNLGGSNRGGTNSVTRNDAIQKKPISAAIGLDDNGGGGGWYFDTIVGTSTVPDDGEFTQINDVFEAQNGTAANDFYRTIVHELGHAMGLGDSNGFLRIGDFLTNGVADPNQAGETLRLLDFNGGGTDYTLTTDGGGHLFEGGGAYAGPVHPNDLMNDGRTVPLSTNIRQLISDTDASLLHDVYGYDVVTPSTINTFYANLNTTTNVVTVTGDVAGVTLDVIDLELTGTNSGDLRVEANSTSEVIPDAEYTTINVNALSNDDDVDVDELESGKSVTVNLGGGNDRADIAQEFDDVDTNLGSNVSVDGGSGTDIVQFHDTQDGNGGDDWTFTTTTVTKNQTGGINRIVSYSTAEELIVDGGPSPTTYDINSLGSGLTNGLTINAGAALDTITLGGTVGDIDSNVNADVNMNGGAGSDALIINDSTDDAGVDDSYTLTSTTFDKSSTTELYTFSSLENITLDAGLADNQITVSNFSATENVTVNGGAGNDTILNGPSFDMNNQWLGHLTINGGADSDTITLSDSADATATEYALTVNTFGVTGGITTNLFVYSTTENFNWTTNNQPTAINITGTASICTYTVNGATGADTFNLGNVGGNAEALNGPLTISGGAGTDAWNYLDSTNPFNNTYTLTSTTVTRTANGVVTFDTVENATLDVGPGAAGGGQLVNVQTFSNIGTGILSLVVNGNTGNDTINLGSGDLENDLAFVPVTVNGAGGTDALYLNDSTDGEGPDGYTFTANTFDKSTAGLDKVTFSGTESVTLDANPFNNTVNINAIGSGVALTARGNDGNDTFNVGNGDMDSNFLGGTLSIDGNGGTSDSVIFDDLTDGPSVDSYAISSTTLDKPNFSAPISYLNFETQRLEASPNADSIVMNSSLPSWRINGNAGVDDINVLGNQVGSSVTVDAGSNGDTVRVNVDNAGSASVTFPNSQTLALLEIGANGTAIVAAGGNKLLFTSALTLNAVSGLLDLNDNDMILDYAGASPLATIRARIASARAAGAWTGFGITSTSAKNNPAHNTTLGLLEGFEFDAVYTPATTFNGVNPDNTSLLIKYTYNGDANFDGRITFDDYVKIDTGFNAHTTGWLNGDFNYDGNVNFDDYVLIDIAFNTQAGVLGRVGGIGIGQRAGGKARIA